MEQEEVSEMSEISSDTLLKPIQSWLLDERVTEIVLNKPKEIFVESSGHFVKHKITEFNSKRLGQIFRLIANENRQELSFEKPLLSGILKNGMRVQLVMPPVSKNYSFAIRKKRQYNLDMTHLSEQGYFNRARAFIEKPQSYGVLDERETQLQSLYRRGRWEEFTKLAIQMGKNMVISGATSSGKTTFLNACLNEIPETERLVILEDTAEVSVPHKNSLRLLANKSDQGISKVSMQELVQCSLRLRPDRIIVGEVRGKELLDFVAASLTGHRGAITTIHAENPQIAFVRMCQMYKLNTLPAMTDEDIYREIKQAVDIIFQLKNSEQGRILQSVYYRLMT